MYTAEGLAHNKTMKGESFLKVCVIADYDRGLCRNKGKKGEYEERQGALFPCGIHGYCFRWRRVVFRGGEQRAI
jgi:hypothetical protein